MSTGAPAPRLSKQKLNQLFLDGLGTRVKEHSGTMSAPLLVDLAPPYALRLRVYIYNCTNPPGGRALDEYKIQIILPGHQRGTRGALDYSDGRMPLLAAYARIADEDTGGVFVLWDAYKHDDFSYSANMQVKSETIIRALCVPVAEMRRGNNEVILAARGEHLYDAIMRRAIIMREDIEGGDVR